MIRILFCNISYLPYYNTRLDRVAPKNGGAYVAKMHDAYEYLYECERYLRDLRDFAFIDS